MPITKAQAWAEADAYFDLLYPGNGLSGHNDAKDAFRHAYTSGVFAMEYGADVATLAGWAWEIRGNYYGQPPEEFNMDMWNNQGGVALAAMSANKAALAQNIKDTMPYFITDPNNTGGKVYDEPQPSPTPTELEDVPWDPSDPSDYPAPLPKDPDFCPVPWLPAELPPLMGPIRNTYSPLVIDLDDDGLELTDIDSNAVYWDFDNDGFKEASAWVQADDALLVMDWNSNGVIDNHIELFGTETVDGFTKLTELDSNTDGVINSSDTLFGDLKIWQDLNQDGISQSGELKSLSAANIVSISLSDVGMSAVVEGNNVTHISSVTMSDTTTRDIFDVWFAYDNQNSQYVEDFDLDVRALFLPTLRGYGEIKDLYVQASLDENLLNSVWDLSDMTLEEVLDPNEHFDEKFKNMLYQWGGQDLYRWHSYYSHYEDSRKVSFVQDIAGEKINSDGALGLYQSIYFRDEGLWEKIVTHYIGNFLSQTVLQEVFTGTPVYNAATGVVTGATGLSSTALDNIKTLIDGTSDPTYGWSIVARVVHEVIGIDNLSGGDFTLLDDAIQDSVPGLDLDTVHDLIMGVPNDVMGTSSGETLEGTFADDSIDAFQGDDTLIGGHGDDRLRGGEGNDTYYGGTGDDYLWENNTWSSNDIYHYESGNDHIVDALGTDKIVLPSGITITDIEFERLIEDNPSDYYIWSSSSLAIKVGDLGRVHIEAQYAFNGNAQFIETLEFADTSTINLMTLDDFQTGTWGNDTITGLDRAYYLNDRLDGDYGDDTLSGGLGRNLLKDFAGNDTYIYGGGFDTIIDNGGTDQIVFDNTYDPNLFTFGVDPFQDPGDPMENAMRIYYDGDLKAVIHNATALGYFFVESLVVDGVTTIDLTALDHSQHGTSGNDTIHGYDAYAWENSTIYGYQGNDYIYGRSGNDELYGNEGTDYILGENGIDEIYGGDGNDTIDGGYDNDILYGDAGNDSIWGSYGNDVIYGGDGLDTLNGEQGSDTFVFEADSAFNDIDIINGYTPFYSGADKLDISDLLVGYTPGVSDINDFVSFTDVGYDSIVSVDRDGVGSTYTSEDIANLKWLGGYGLDPDALLSAGNLIV